MRQTTVQEANTIRFGSGKFEVGDDVGSLVDVGAMRNIVFQEVWDKVRVMSDNAGEVDVGIRNHRAGLSGDLMELNLTNLNTIRGGIDSYSTQDGTTVSGETQTVTSGNWSYNDFIKIENQNADGSQITVNSVTGGTDGALTENTDYYVGEDENGNWGIFIIDGTNTTTESQDLTIDYDYTPAASKTLKSGGKMTLSAKVVRVTNVDENGKKFQITVYKATAEEGINLEFQADDAEDPAMVSINMLGALDTSKAAGEQLFEILDEQGA